MNGINRRSQKVRCIQAIEVFDRNDVKFPGPYPQLNAVYTVDAFMDSGQVDRGGQTGPTLPGIALLEIPPLRCKGGLLLGWPLFIFRPLDERKTGEAVKELLSAVAKPGIETPALAGAT